jgi:hypothetical protein
MSSAFSAARAACNASVGDEVTASVSVAPCGLAWNARHRAA